ncbi:MAG: hypothetical protein D6730_15185 [Bacteroidetes bacterium]|nr:MAG: hypothetical protein D6730_15185 [Bacteroidota bacterium]
MAQNLTKNMSPSFFQIAGDVKLLLRSVKIALLVGSIYNLINQGDLLVQGLFHQINYVKICLTYMTPFFVATYSATVTTLKMLRKQQAAE